MKKVLIFSILTTVISSIYSQPNLVEGYVILLDKDTVRGWIDYHDQQANPESIRFKKTGDTNFTIFHPNQVTEFRGKGFYYISRVVKMDKSLDYVDGPLGLVQSSIQASMITVTIFLDVIVKSKLSIYHFKDDRDINHYFIETPSGPIEELLNKKMRQGQSEKFANIELYKNQLSAALIGCPDLAEKIKKSSLSKESLLNLLLAYDNCVLDTPTYTQEMESIKIHTNVMLGCAFNSISFGNSPLNQGSFKSYYLPIGLSFEFVSAGNKKKWALVIDLLHHNTTAKDKIVSGFGPAASSTKEIQIKVGRVSVNTNIKYYFNTNPNRMFLTVGLSNSYLYKVDQNYTSTFAEKKYGLGFIGGMGRNFNRITIQGRLEVVNGISNGQGYGSTINSLSLLAAYRL